MASLEENEGDVSCVENAPATGVCVGFAQLPPDAHIELNAVARILNRSTKSVQRAVRRGDLPAPFKFLGKLTWLAGVIVEHLKSKQKAVLQLSARRNERLVQHTP